MRTYRIVRKKEADRKKQADRRFPYHVDLPVSVSGLGRGLTGMFDWCCDNAPIGAWGMSTVRSERHKGEAPADFVRFYFMNDADAEAFRRRWVR
jgi:hypothetical protein